MDPRKQNIEIEHKYLVQNNSYRNMATSRTLIRQGYISTDPERVVRIRQKGDKAFITIKSKTNPTTLVRFEWEREIELSDAEQLFELCLPNMIEKVRYVVPWHGLLVEIDEFHGVNEGLVIAEIELQYADQPLPALPDFIGQDVSNEPKYTNSNLAVCPYTKW